jgi:rod shape-determining protein MreC
MRQLLDSILSFKEYLVLTLCVLLSLLLIASGNSPQMRSIRSGAIVAMGALQDFFNVVPDYLGLAEENRILHEQNLSLSEELSRLREAAHENVQLHKLLSLKERSSFSHIGANVVGKNFQFFRNTITLDVGENEGIRADMPVVTSAGLVGRIVATGSGYSIAQTLFHREMRTSVRVERGRVDGILAWNGGMHLSLTNVAKTLDVKVGDQVVTSEYSSIFPPGIPVGVVTGTSEETGALFQTIEVSPFADLYRLDEVFVILHTPDSARVALEQQAAR